MNWDVSIIKTYQVCVGILVLSLIVKAALTFLTMQSFSLTHSKLRNLSNYTAMLDTFM